MPIYQINLGTMYLSDLADVSSAAATVRGAPLVWDTIASAWTPLIDGQSPHLVVTSMGDAVSNVLRVQYGVNQGISGDMRSWDYYAQVDPTYGASVWFEPQTARPAAYTTKINEDGMVIAKHYTMDNGTFDMLGDSIFQSSTTDQAGGYAYLFDTLNTVTSSMLAEFDNAGSPMFQLDKDGNGWFASSVSADDMYIGASGSTATSYIYNDVVIGGDTALSASTKDSYKLIFNFTDAIVPVSWTLAVGDDATYGRSLLIDPAAASVPPIKLTPDHGIAVGTIYCLAKGGSYATNSFVSEEVDGLGNIGFRYKLNNSFSASGTSAVALYDSNDNTIFGIGNAGALWVGDGNVYSDVVDSGHGGTAAFTFIANNAMSVLPYYRFEDASGTSLLTIGTSGDLTLNSKQIHSVADPTSAQDAATKAYVDAATSGGGGANATTDLTDVSSAASTSDGQLLRWNVASSAYKPDLGQYDPDLPPDTPGEIDDEFTTSALDPAWSWKNTTPAIVDVSNRGYLVAQDTVAQAGFSILARASTIGTADFDIRAKIWDASQPQVGATRRTQVGVIVADSSANWRGSFYRNYVANTSQWIGHNGGAGWGSADAFAGFGYIPEPLRYVRITRVSNILHFYGSIDGIGWIEAPATNAWAFSVAFVGIAFKSAWGATNYPDGAVVDWIRQVSP